MTELKKYSNVAKQKKNELFVPFNNQLLMASSKIGKKWKKSGNFVTLTASKYNPKSMAASTLNRR